MHHRIHCLFIAVEILCGGKAVSLFVQKLMYLRLFEGYYRYYSGVVSLMIHLFVLIQYFFIATPPKDCFSWGLPLSVDGFVGIINLLIAWELVVLPLRTRLFFSFSHARRILKVGVISSSTLLVSVWGLLCTVHTCTNT